MARSHARILRDQGDSRHNKFQLLRHIVQGNFSYQPEALPALEKDLRALSSSANRDIASLAQQAIDKLFPQEHSPQDVQTLLAECLRQAQQIIQQKEQIKLNLSSRGFEAEVEAFERQGEQILEQHNRLNEEMASLSNLLLDRQGDAEVARGRFISIPESDVIRRDHYQVEEQAANQEIVRLTRRREETHAALQAMEQTKQAALRHGEILRAGILRWNERVQNQDQAEDQALADQQQRHSHQLARLEAITSPEPVSDLGNTVSPEAIALRDRVRNSGQRLLFTRNIDLAELGDMVSHGAIRGKHSYAINYFRYGLSHEYGQAGEVVTVVMKRGFWSQEKDLSHLGNLFLREFDGQELMEEGWEPMGAVSRSRVLELFGSDRAWEQFFVEPDAGYLRFKRNAGKIIAEAGLASEQKAGLNRMMAGMCMMQFRTFIGGTDREGLLNDLVKAVEYNRLLEKKKYDEPQGDDYIGKTIIGPGQESFMGHYPQLEIGHEIGLDMVERIMVPEHMWESVSARAAHNPALRALLQKIEGTGATEAEFLEGRDRLGRRSRRDGGSIRPNFGDPSFHAFEQAYLKLMLEADKVRSGPQDFQEIFSIATETGFHDALEQTNLGNLIPGSNPLRRLIGIQQYPSHRGLDPLQHTFNAMKLMHTERLADLNLVMPTGFQRPMVELLRIAMLYHDLGKVKDAFAEDHAQHSAELATWILKTPALSVVGSLTSQEQEFVLTLIRTHQLFGDFNKFDIDLATAVQQVRSELAGPFHISTMFYFHMIIATADIHSIPGVRERLEPDKWSNYESEIYRALGENS